MRVFVYYNLHRHCWSIKALEGKDKGRVILHSDTVSLKNCQLKVSESGRKRVLLEKRKNVHAGIVGYLVSKVRLRNKKEVTYNPYKYKSFVDVLKKLPVNEAGSCFMKNKRVWVSA